MVFLVFISVLLLFDLYVLAQTREPVALQDKLFLVEYKGNNISWKPHSEFEKGVKQKSWVKLSGIVKKGFKGVKLKETPIFYKGNNLEKENDSINKISNLNLNKQTIEQFWNVLKQDKYMSALYFTVGKPPPSSNTNGNKKEKEVEESKHHLLIRFDNETFKWYPSSTTDPDWDDEYEKLKKDICNHFNLDTDDSNSNESMKIEMIVSSGNDDEDSKDEMVEVEGGDDLDGEWSDMMENESSKKMFIECVVSGARMKEKQNKSEEDSDMKDMDMDMDMGDSKTDKVILSQEMIDEYNDKVMKFDFNEKHNAEKEMGLLLDNLLFRKIYWSDEVKEESAQDSANAISNDEIVEGIVRLIDRLLESLDREGNSAASMIVRSVKECRQAIDSTSSDWKNGYKRMKEAMDRLRPFNIDEMLSLYEKTAEAAKQIENQDAVLILGHTGAG